MKMSRSGVSRAAFSAVEHPDKLMQFWMTIGLIVHILVLLTDAEAFSYRLTRSTLLEIGCDFNTH